MSKFERPTQVVKTHEEPGLCATYYKDSNKRVFCTIQETQGCEPSWYFCSRDGEPAMVIKPDSVVVVDSFKK